MEANVVTVGQRDELATATIPVADAVLHRGAERVDHVRLRSHGRALPAGLNRDRLELEAPVAGAAPGQLACLLEGDVVVGYATITR